MFRSAANTTAPLKGNPWYSVDQKRTAIRKFLLFTILKVLVISALYSGLGRHIMYSTANSSLYLCWQPHSTVYRMPCVRLDYLIYADRHNYKVCINVRKVKCTSKFQEHAEGFKKAHDRKLYQHFSHSRKSRPIWVCFYFNHY